MNKNGTEKNSNTKEYIISGTIDDIINVLVSDFDLSMEEARFVVYVLTLEKSDKTVFVENDIRLWYLNEQIPSTSSFFKLPYSISITKLELEIQRILFLFIGTLLISKEAAVVTFGLEFIWTLHDAIQKIKEDEYCVYGRIVDFVYTTNKDLFKIKDIIPYDSGNECNRKPDTLKCPYWNNDICSLTEKHIETILEKLVQEGVLKKVNEYWMMIK